MGSFQTFGNAFLTDGAAFAADPDCCCGECPSTEDDLDITFDNDIDDCATVGFACESDCTALNGNTYRLIFVSGITWAFTEGPGVGNISMAFTCNSGTKAWTFVADIEGSVQDRCFKDSGTLSLPLPLSLTNQGVCGDTPAAGNCGENGTAELVIV